MTGATTEGSVKPYHLRVTVLWALNIKFRTFSTLFESLPFFSGLSQPNTTCSTKKSSKKMIFFVHGWFRVLHVCAWAFHGCAWMFFETIFRTKTRLHNNFMSFRVSSKHNFEHFRILSKQVSFFKTNPALTNVDDDRSGKSL